MHKSDDNQLLETICSQGCIYVNSIIELLEAGHPTEHTQNLSQQEQDYLLIELKSIMSVYQKNSSSQ